VIAQLLGRKLANRLRAAPDIDPSVAEAMIAIERHRLVSWRQVLRAYDDRSLPTGPATSISQPTYVAKLISHARIQTRVTRLTRARSHSARMSRSRDERGGMYFEAVELPFSGI
jgi:Protein-L-isoaspartate(D-aspartate) O-methyltransferase (PCMT)